MTSIYVALSFLKTKIGKYLMIAGGFVAIGFYFVRYGANKEKRKQEVEVMKDYIHTRKNIDESLDYDTNPSIARERMRERKNKRGGGV